MDKKTFAMMIMTMFGAKSADATRPTRMAILPKDSTNVEVKQLPEDSVQGVNTAQWKNVLSTNSIDDVVSVHDTDAVSPIEKISSSFSQNFLRILADWTQNAPDIRYYRIGKRIIANQKDYTRQDKYFHRKFNKEHTRCIDFFQKFIAEHSDLKEKIENYELIDIVRYLKKVRYTPKASCASTQNMIYFQALMETIQNCRTSQEACTAIYMANVMSGVTNPNSAREYRNGLLHLCTNMCTNQSPVEALRSTDGIVQIFRPRNGGSGYHAYGGVEDVIGGANRAKFCLEDQDTNKKGTYVFDLSKACIQAMKAYQSNNLLAYTSLNKATNYTFSSNNYNLAQKNEKRIGNNRRL
ncbi:MAG: hypothetical protein J6N45_07180 [Alphaproteobacteria bacterium]|nr:hypothetical protein [Alphaproteobacteria bacterium]